MKTVALALLALTCVVGLVTAQGYGGYGGYPQRSGGSNMGLLGLIGACVLLFALLGNSSSSGSTTLIYGNFTAPVGK